MALLNHDLFSVYAQHNSDRQALTYLEDVWVARNPQETRAFTIEFVSPIQLLKSKILNKHAVLQRESLLLRFYFEKGVQIRVPAFGI